MSEDTPAQRLQRTVDPSLENLALFYKSLTTERLAIARGGYENDLREARTRKGKGARHTAKFNEERIALIDRVLGERGISVDQARALLDQVTGGNRT